MPEFQFIPAGEVTLRAVVQGSGPLVILVHGFPESWYSWRHQLGPITEAGFTACAIDVRGYGGSDKPQPVAAYGLEQLAQDLVGVADALQPGTPAILVGHDWGAPIVWNTAFTRPDRFRAVAGLSVPFAGVPQRPFTEVFRELFTSKGVFFYQEYFQKEGVAEAELEADLPRFLRVFLHSISGEAPPNAWPLKPVDSLLLTGLPEPAAPSAWLSEADLAYYVSEFAASGLRGPLNRYRNHERDHAWLQGYAGRTLDQPALFIGGERDPATTLFGQVSDPVAMMRHFAPNVDGTVLPGCGHWTQQERPEAVNRLLVDWLGRV